MPALWPWRAAAGEAAPAPALIDFYYEPGCPECERVDAEILPELEARYPGAYRLQRWDLGEETNFFKLVKLQERLGNPVNAHVFMSVGAQCLLAGYSGIATGLWPALEACWLDGARAPAAAEPAGAEPPLLAERLRRFTLWGIVVAGLVDSINPCAIATLVFFISLLAVARVQGRVLLAAGTAFCVAAYVTYFVIGFGLLRAFYLFAGYRLLQQTINAAMVALVLAFAWLSFRDAWRYQRTRDPRVVVLQLPERLKRQTHTVMRRGLKARHITLGGLAIGSLVTLLEAVCTGQVYVPTLVYLIKSGTAVGHSLAYLALYNFLFILPLIVVFLLTYRGLQFQKLQEWSRREVVVSKILLGCFFLAMAALLLIL
jgi:hypothetical protein